MLCQICCCREATPGWETCEYCDREALLKSNPDIVYFDQLGIGWTEQDLKEAGGIGEVSKLAMEADARGKYLNKSVTPPCGRGI